MLLQYYLVRFCFLYCFFFSRTSTKACFIGTIDHIPTKHDYFFYIFTCSSIVFFRLYIYFSCLFGYFFHLFSAWFLRSVCSERSHREIFVSRAGWVPRPTQTSPPPRSPTSAGWPGSRAGLNPPATACVTVFQYG